jgi:putative ABC transport system substrate-binding protein
MKAADAEALLVTADSLFVWQQARIAELAQKNGMPSMFHSRGGVQAGGLMSYGQDLEAIYRHAATYVDKILKGSKAAELPVEQPMRAHLAINRKTARVLRINVPTDLLLRADEVIE